MPLIKQFYQLCSLHDWGTAGSCSFIMFVLTVSSSPCWRIFFTEYRQPWHRSISQHWNYKKPDTYNEFVKSLSEACHHGEAEAKQAIEKHSWHMERTNLVFPLSTTITLIKFTKSEIICNSPIRRYLFVSVGAKSDKAFAHWMSCLLNSSSFSSSSGRYGNDL